MFRSLIYLEFSYEYSIKPGSKVILEGCRIALKVQI